MGLLSNRISKESLKPGDHIYSWRTAYIYAHHGIYIGDDKAWPRSRNRDCAGYPLVELSASPLHCPLSQLHYAARWSWGHRLMPQLLPCWWHLVSGLSMLSALLSFLQKCEAEPCTLAVSDSNDNCGLIEQNTFLKMDLNNCEDFAIYCKTALLIVDQGTMGQSGQAASIIGGPLAAVLSTPMRLVTTNIYGMAATAVGVYCASRYAADIGMRRDVVKVSAEDLTRRLATGLLQVSEPQISVAPIQVIQ
uniref:LRAT domain-containing protein n=1 Tax=Salix viminalis TaxID=40686 RepID=A0A6N2MVS9_SALVM